MPATEVEPDAQELELALAQELELALAQALQQLY